MLILYRFFAKSRKKSRYSRSVTANAVAGARTAGHSRAASRAIKTVESLRRMFAKRSPHAQGILASAWQTGAWQHLLRHPFLAHAAANINLEPMDDQLVRWLDLRPSRDDARFELLPVSLRAGFGDAPGDLRQAWPPDFPPVVLAVGPPYGLHHPDAAPRRASPWGIRRVQAAAASPLAKPRWPALSSSAARRICGSTRPARSATLLQSAAGFVARTPENRSRRSTSQTRCSDLRGACDGR